MAYVIAEPCVDVLDQSCVAVCPVDCIHFEVGGDRKLFIDPDECIDCEACVPECPVAAIFHQDNLPAEWAGYTQLNAEMAPQCPGITEQKTSMAETHGSCTAPKKH